MRTLRHPSPAGLSLWLMVFALWLLSGCSRNMAQESSGPITSPLPGPSGSLYVDDGGDGGLPVVFVHSFAGSSAHWSRQLGHLRTTRRALALDLRGHGQSESPASGSYEVDSLAADIGAVVDAAKLDRFVLVGHSMGGSAAIAYAAAHPERVAGLVLVGTPGRTPPEQAQQVMASMEADYEKVSEDYWKQLLTGASPEVASQIRIDTERVPKDVSLSIIRNLFAWDPIPRLDAYSGPKLLIDTPHGESPGALHNLEPNVPRRVIEGTSHWPQLDRPDEFNILLDEFLHELK